MGHSYGPREEQGGAHGTVLLQNPQVTSRKACLRNADSSWDDEVGPLLNPVHTDLVGWCWKLQQGKPRTWYEILTLDAFQRSSSPPCCCNTPSREEKFAYQFRAPPKTFMGETNRRYEQFLYMFPGKSDGPGGG